MNIKHELDLNDQFIKDETLQCAYPKMHTITET
jgi:hypothetical protein